MSSSDVESGPLVFLSLHVRGALRTEGHGACALRATLEVVLVEDNANGKCCAPKVPAP